MATAAPFFKTAPSESTSSPPPTQGGPVIAALLETNASSVQRFTPTEWPGFAGDTLLFCLDAPRDDEPPTSTLIAHDCRTPWQE